MPLPGEYQVEGYNTKIPEYDGPYLEGHDFDPGFVYAYAGNSELQEEYQNGLQALAEVDAASREAGYQPTPVDAETGEPTSTPEATTPLDSGGPVTLPTEPVPVEPVPVDPATEF